jgi:hypothetical protein
VSDSSSIRIGMEEELPSEQKALFVEASVENGLGQPAW